MAITDVHVAHPAAEGRGKLEGRPWITYTAVVAAALVLWHLLSLVVNPLFLPSPLRVGAATVELIGSGEMLQHVSASYGRVLSGWFIGAALAIPLGSLAGRVALLRVALEPFLNFFRFVPPIAFLSLALIWLGIGETSKVALIVYASFFIVFLSAVAGVQGVDKEKIHAAQCLGASRRQVITTVVMPAAVPEIVTGLRTAMGIAFMTVVAAELVAAETGIGFLIYNSRLFARTDIVFAGILALGVMGLTADILFRQLTRPIHYRYALRF